MSITINLRSVLWAIGVLQPVAVEEIETYFRTVLSDAGGLPTSDELRRSCLRASDIGLLVRVWRTPDLFSLSLLGNRYLDRSQRKSRDRARIFLLKDARKARVRLSREAEVAGLGGEPPSVTVRSTQQGGESNRLVLFVPRGRTCWPRPSGQLKTGPSLASRDIYPTLLSFSTQKQLAVARHQLGSPPSLDPTTLGLMLGVSPRLIQWIARQPEQQYRSFELAKQGGGVRRIESPRVFLKVIQQFILDYILAGLPMSDAVHSFRTGASIHSNARPHKGAAYVGSIDVVDFFGSIRKESVERWLTQNDFSPQSARLLSRLITKDGALPQGAPSSPLISNSILYNFDEYMSNLCLSAGLAYSRYADDITISGYDQTTVSNMLKHANRVLLKDYSLHVNERKTRIVSKNSQQRVTGIVVNEKLLPPRAFRRRIRAAFFEHSKKSETDIEQIRKLLGYLSYLQSFEDLCDKVELKKYREILQSVRVAGTKT